MSDMDTRIDALLDEVRLLGTGELTQFASTVRTRLPSKAQLRLGLPKSHPKATIANDLETLRAIADNDDVRSRALAAWASFAEETLGRGRAERAVRRKLAEDDPGRIDDPVFGEVVQEKTKLDVMDDLVRADWALLAAKAAESVGYIEVTRVDGGVEKTREAGTVFMVGPGLVMTAYHVIAMRDPVEDEPTVNDAAAQVASARIDFDYLAPLQAGQSITEHRVARVVIWSRELDFALLELADPKPARDPLVLSAAAPAAPKTGLTEIANIIQHPGKRKGAAGFVDDGRKSDPKKIGLRNNAIWKVQPDLLYYFTDTRGGSSGAPVFNDEWRVMAVHTGWGPVQDTEKAIYLGRNFTFVNRGTRITRIIDHVNGKNLGVTLTAI
jgi:hypothetical protein